MSFASYEQLQVEISNWLTLPAHASRIPQLISLFEARVKRELRVRQMERRSTASTTSGTATLALPSDYLEMRNLRINGSPIYTLQSLPPNVIDSWYSNQTTSRPKAYKVVASEIIFAPIPDSAYTVEMDYYYFDVLSSSTTSNWLLTSAPDAYLYGSLANVAGLQDPDKRWPEWKALADEILTKIRDEDRGARWNGAPLVARPDYVVP